MRRKPEPGSSAAIDRNKLLDGLGYALNNLHMPAGEKAALGWVGPEEARLDELAMLQAREKRREAEERREWAGKLRLVPSEPV